MGKNKLDHVPFRYEQLERERSEFVLNAEQARNDLSLQTARIRSLEEELQIKISEFQSAQVEVSALRDRNS